MGQIGRDIGVYIYSLLKWYLSFPKKWEKEGVKKKCSCSVELTSNLTFDFVTYAVGWNLTQTKVNGIYSIETHLQPSQTVDLASPRPADETNAIRRFESFYPTLLDYYHHHHYFNEYNVPNGWILPSFGWEKQLIDS